MCAAAAPARFIGQTGSAQRSSCHGELDRIGLVAFPSLFSFFSAFPKSFYIFCKKLCYIFSETFSTIFSLTNSFF
jgi:hypothetical protein